MVRELSHQDYQNASTLNMQTRQEEDTVGFSFLMNTVIYQAKQIIGFPGVDISTRHNTSRTWFLCSHLQQRGCRDQTYETAVRRTLLQCCGLGDTFCQAFCSWLSLEHTITNYKSRQAHQWQGRWAKLCFWEKKNSEDLPLSSHAVYSTGKLGNLGERANGKGAHMLFTQIT